ncbi:hypothetical protein ABZT03_01820 [Streptomyces sp. NPDC005574]|uniref:hypothetical protein n=1 Tax=Streptomyces sp. NPDC005574 TaxID=3156891 RepID=UPI0033AE63B3
MTQSGQGEEPSARPAREGIVLPSDGGEPLLPGMTGGYTGPYGGRQSGQRDGDGGRHGQESQNGHSGAYGQSGPYGGQGAHGDPYAAQQGGGPYADHGAAAQGGHQSGPYGGQQPGPYGDQGAAPQGGQQPPAVAPTGGQAWGTPWGPGQQQAPAPQPEQGGWNRPAAQPAPWGAPEASGGGIPSQPLPAEETRTPAPYGTIGGYGQPAAAGYAEEGATQFLPPVQAGPASAPEGATQFLPPVQAGPAPAPEGATQFLPPVPADEGATQYIPPVAPGALPPEIPAESAAESTHYLGRAQSGPGPGAGPLPPAAHPDAQATQFIPPVPGQNAAPPFGGEQDRQPPAEFDNLFRSGPGGDGPAGATQQLPRFAQPEPQRPAPAAYSPQPAYAPPGQGGGHRGYDDGDDGGRGGRSGSRLPLIAAVGIGIAVLGIGAGALLSGGGGDGGSDDKDKTVSATAPATQGSASPSADPAKQQATALDKLLADSGASRASVISAVAAVKNCDNLGQAAKDLRGAAAQRGQLVTRLSGLTVDKLPDHAELTTALTKAWQASASADEHYAAWADQTAGRKGCKKGQARTTGQTVAGNQASGTASTQKARASQLWNAIAKSYGLTQRTPTQL